MSQQSLKRASHFAIIVLVFLLSCAPEATQITATWKDPAAGRYEDFFVAVLTKNLTARKTMEGDLSTELKRSRVKVKPSLEELPHSEKPETAEERNAILEKIRSLGHDAILTVSLLKQTEESRYTPGSVQYAPTTVGYGTGYNNDQNLGNAGAGSYGAFGMYYINSTSVSNSPGYYETIKVYFIESRLYDAGTGKLIWSVQSQEFNPENLATASIRFSKDVVNSLKTNNLIGGKEGK